MAIPPTAQKFAGVLDPNEELDYLARAGTLLEVGEAIQSYNLTVLPEGVALGLTIMSGAGRDHGLNDTATGVDMWLTIDPSFKGNAAFNAAGTALPLHLNLVTDSVPARIRDRTFLVQVAQQ